LRCRRAACISIAEVGRTPTRPAALPPQADAILDIVDDQQPKQVILQELFYGSGRRMGRLIVYPTGINTREPRVRFNQRGVARTKLSSCSILPFWGRPRASRPLSEITQAYWWRPRAVALWSIAGRAPSASCCAAGPASVGSIDFSSRTRTSIMCSAFPVSSRRCGYDRAPTS